MCHPVTFNINMITERGIYLNTIIYVRGGNIDNQLNECIDYALEKGYNIVGIAEQENHLDHYILSNNVDYLLVSDLSRISRRQNEYLQVEKMLQKFGIVIRSVEE